MNLWSLQKRIKGFNLCSSSFTSRKNWIQERSPFTTSNTETSIITTNVRQKNLSNENLKHKHWCFQISKIVSQRNHIGILIYNLPSKTFFWDIFLITEKKQQTKYQQFSDKVFNIIKGLCLWVVQTRVGDDLL